MNDNSEGHHKRRNKGTTGSLLSILQRSTLPLANSFSRGKGGVRKSTKPLLPTSSSAGTHSPKGGGSTKSSNNSHSASSNHTIELYSVRDRHDSTGKRAFKVQMPRRLLYYTLGVFLVLPVFIFIWKEFHLHPAPHNDSVMVKESWTAGRHVGHERFANWMESAALPDPNAYDSNNVTVTSESREDEIAAPAQKGSTDTNPALDANQNTKEKSAPTSDSLLPAKTASADQTKVLLQDAVALNGSSDPKKSTTALTANENLGITQQGLSNEAFAQLVKSVDVKTTSSTEDHETNNKAGNELSQDTLKVVQEFMDSNTMLDAAKEEIGDSKKEANDDDTEG